MIGPDSTSNGIPAIPPTVMVIPMSDLDPPKSCINQKRNDSMYPQAVPVEGEKKNIYLGGNRRFSRQAH